MQFNPVLDFKGKQQQTTSLNQTMTLGATWVRLLQFWEGENPETRILLTHPWILHHQMKKNIRRMTTTTLMVRVVQLVGKPQNLRVLYVEIAILRKLVCPITWTYTPEQGLSNVNTVQKRFHTLLPFMNIAKHISHRLINAIIVPKCLPKNITRIGTC